MQYFRHSLSGESLERHCLLNFHSLVVLFTVRSLCHLKSIPVPLNLRSSKVVSLHLLNFWKYCAEQIVLLTRIFWQLYKPYNYSEVLKFLWPRTPWSCVYFVVRKVCLGGGRHAAMQADIGGDPGVEETRPTFNRWGTNHTFVLPNFEETPTRSTNFTREIFLPLF